MAIFDSFLQLAGAIAGPIIGGIFNERATTAAVEGQQAGIDAQIALTREAIEELRAGKEEALERIDVGIARALGLLDEGTLRSIEQYQQLISIGQPGVTHLREVAGLRPDQLTSAQEIGKQDLIRETNTQLATSGLRGAGRSGQAVLADAIGRYIANAQTQNLARSDSAASELARIGIGGREKVAAAEANRGRGGANIVSGGATAGANAALGTGTNIANLQENLGSSTADIAGNIGQFQGENQAARGKLIGTAIGNITGLISDSEKRKQTEGRFPNGTQLGLA